MAQCGRTDVTKELSHQLSYWCVKEMKSRELSSNPEHTLSALIIFCGSMSWTSDQAGGKIQYLLCVRSVRRDVSVAVLDISTLLLQRRIKSLKDRDNVSALL